MASRWIVSKNYDLIFFIGSVAVSFAFLGLYFVAKDIFHLPAIAATLLIQNIFFFGLDQPHIFQTVSRVYFDKDQFRKIKFTATFGFAGLLATIAVLTYFGYTKQFLMALDVIGSFHIIRQNVGFMKAYKRLNNDYAPIDNFFDQTVYYVGMFACVLKGISTDPSRDADEAFFPAWVGNSALVVSVIAVIAYIIWQIAKRRRGQRANLPKLLLMSTTLMTHHVIYYFVRMPGLETVMDTAYHDVQYHGWMAHYQKRRFAKIRNVVWKWLGAAIAFGLLSKFLFSLENSAALYVQNTLFGIILFHYYIDGFIWKFGADRDLAKLLFSPVSDPSRHPVEELVTPPQAAS